MKHRVLLLSAALLALSACQAADRGAPAVPEAPTDDRGAPAAPDPPTENGEARLTPDGWGPLAIGMTREEVVEAAGEDANPGAVGGPEAERCDEFRPERAPAGMLVMIEEGVLTRISLGSSSEVLTDDGFGVGDAGSAVRAGLGGEAIASPHKYVSAPAEYLTRWATAPPGPAARGIRYEVGADGLVSRVHAGGPSIEYVEGCL